MEMSIKSSLRNFGDYRSISSKYDQVYESPSFAIQLNQITKMMEDSVYKFTKRYLIILTELEEMKREFIAQASTVTEYLTLTKKEARLEKFEKYQQGKAFVSIPNCPGYEHRCIVRGDKRDARMLSIGKINGNGISTLSSQSKQRPSSTQKKVMSTNTTNSNCKYRPCSPAKKFNAKNLFKQYTKNDSISNKKPETGRLNSSFNSQNKAAASTASKKNNIDINTLNDSINLNTSVAKNISFPNKDPNVKSTCNMTKLEKKEYHQNMMNTLNDPFFKAVYFLTTNNMIPPNEKINLAYLNHEISSRIIPTNILNDSLELLNQKLSQLELTKLPLDAEEASAITKLTAYPSKTALTGLNFLTKEREKELMNSDSQATEELIKMIYKCLGEDISKFGNYKEAYDSILETYHVKGIKELFEKKIYPKIYMGFTDDVESYDEIITSIQKNKELITDSLVNNTNKTFSYIAFSLEEISDFLSQLKLTNKETKAKLRKELEIKNIKEQIDEIKKKIY